MAGTDFVTESQVDSLAAAVVGHVNTIAARVGTLASLNTSAKSSLVAAINEVVAATGGTLPEASDTVKGIVELATSGEATTGTSTVLAVTPAGVKAVADALRTEILGGVGSAQDTLAELKAYVDSLDAADDGDISAILTALGNRVRVDAAQSFTSPQQAQGRANLGIATSSQDFAADYTAAVV